MCFSMHVWSGHSQGMRTDTQSETITVPLKTKGLCGSANLISHSVRALLPQAQGRGDKTQQFVHILIAYPSAVKKQDMFNSLGHRLCHYLNNLLATNKD